MLAIDGGIPVRETPLYYGHQYIDDHDIDAVVQVLKSDFLTCGPKITELEARLGQLVQAKHVTAVANGTAALHIACLAAGIKAGDEVITTPVTFAASANCALYCGARPVFADIRPDTYNISPDEIRRLITNKTKAVIAVDFTGQAVELNEISSICRDHGLTLIEDAAHAIGTRYEGKPVGNIADLTTFSFHPVKTVTGGEGGAVATNREDLHEKLALFRSHGITRDPSKLENISDDSWYYEQIALGFNYRMSDIHAALLISQLDKLGQFAQRRRQIVKAYDDAFRDMPEVCLQKTIEESDTVQHLYILRLNPNRLKADRGQIFEALKAENIYCNVHYIPIYYFPFYQKLGYRRGICPQAEKLYDEMITLPLYYSMSDEDASDVIEAVKKVLGHYRK